MIRRQKKEYYSGLLKKNRNNMKATWGIINNVIKNGTYLVKNNTSINDGKTIVNEFNKHFVNI